MDVLLIVLVFICLPLMLGALALGLYQLWENIKWGRELDAELKRMNERGFG
jgi:hypothetical protein